MLGVWSLGRPLEAILGQGRFLILYLVSALGGSLLALLLDPDLARPAIGASGALLGLLGALGVFFPNSRLLIFFIPMKARTALLGIALGSAFLHLTDSLNFISHLGHLGGLLSGYAFVRLLSARRFRLHGADRESSGEEISILRKEAIRAGTDEKDENLRYDPISGRYVSAGSGNIRSG